MQNSSNKPSIKFRNRVLKACEYGDCKEYCIWDYNTCYKHLSNEKKYVIKDRLLHEFKTNNGAPGIILTYCDLSNFDFQGMDLSNSFLNHCNLENSNLCETNLYSAFLQGANLKNSNLCRAELNSTVFTHACLYNSELLAYSLSFGRKPINLYYENFQPSYGKGKAKINESDPFSCKAAYRSLKAYFNSNGQYDDESWAAFKERVMQRKNYWNSKDYVNWFISSIFGFACGYGERPINIFIFNLSIISIFSIIYKSGNLVIELNGDQNLSIMDAFCYSLLTFSSMSVPQLVPNELSVCRILTAIEALFGLFAFGLFIFTVTKKFVAR